MSNSDPSAIVLQGIRCIGGLYISLDSNGENGSLKSKAGYAWGNSDSVPAESINHGVHGGARGKPGLNQSLAS
jgi:hypothetical protein